MKKRIIVIFCVFLIFIQHTFAQKNEILKDFPDYKIIRTIQAEKDTVFYELYSDAKDSVKILCTSGKSGQYEILYENHQYQNAKKSKYAWYYSALFYSKKSQTLYYHLNKSPQSVNGIDVYCEPGLFTFKPVNGKFCKEGMKHYFVPLPWMILQAYDAFVNDNDEKSYIDWVTYVSDSRVQSPVKNEAYFKLNEKALLEEISGLHAQKTWTFLYSYDGLWLIVENASQKKIKNSDGSISEQWSCDYYLPFLIEDRNGNFCPEQDPLLSKIKIHPSSSNTLNDREFMNVCSVYKDYLLMQNINDSSFFAYKKGELIQKENYFAMITFLDSNKGRQKSFKGQNLIIIALSLLLIFAVIFNLIILSKKFSQHLNKKDKKLIFDIQNKERIKLSRDLHDSAVQTIRAIRTDVELLEVSKDELTRKDQIIKELTDCIILLRNICYNLSPAEISLAENSGELTETNPELLSIIDTLCKQFSQKTKIPCTINTKADFTIPLFSLEVSKHTVRIIQEILSNIEKHSFATSVNIFLSKIQNDKGNMLKIVIIDDGIGCQVKDMTKKKHHFGVRNIMESINLIGGKVDFYSKENEGLNIVLEIPCKNDSGESV